MALQDVLPFSGVNPQTWDPQKLMNRQTAQNNNKINKLKIGRKDESKYFDFVAK